MRERFLKNKFRKLFYGERQDYRLDKKDIKVACICRRKESSGTKQKKKSVEKRTSTDGLSRPMSLNLNLNVAKMPRRVNI